MTEAEKRSNEKKAEGQEMGFLAHLIELRDRILRMVIVIVVGFAVLFPFAGEIYTFLSGPLTKHLPEGSSMIAIDVASPFLTPFKMVLMLSVVITIPFLLHQLWSFIAPGLYRHEKRLAVPLLASSVILFYLGMAFAYYVVFPLIFGFFTSVAPEGVEVMTDINRYLDFVVMLFLAFGIAFEVPVATILLIATGATTAQKLSKARPYIVVGAFVIGMLLTPPDIISQVLLAIPMWLLFELGLLASRYFVNPSASGETSDPVDSDAESKTDRQSSSSTPSSSPSSPSSTSPSPKEAAIAQALISAPYEPLSDAEMEAELDAIEEEEDEEDEDSENNQ